MAESTLSLERTALQKSIGLLLSFGLDPTAWEADQRSQIDHCLDVGQRRAYAPVVLPGEKNAHEWSFLKPLMTGLQIHGAYEEGTIVIASGVVTLTDGTWPSWAASGQVVVDNIAYDVDTRDSDTQLTLDDLTVTEASTEYSLQESTLTLPDNFGGFENGLYFEANTTNISTGLRRVHLQEILEARQVSLITSWPRVFAVHAIPPTGTVFQKWYVTFYPAPDADRTLTGLMTINPDRLTSSATFPAGGYQFAELLRESCLAAAESEIMGEPNGPHYQLFQQRLVAAVSHDRMMSNPGILGYQQNSIMWPSLRHESGSAYARQRDWLRHYSQSPVTYF